MPVYLVRHGEDRAAAEDRFGDLGLSQRGRDQALALARRLAHVPFRLAIASPLERAGETARVLLRERAVPLEIVPCFAEGSIGALDGMTRAAARASYPQVFQRGEGLLDRLGASGWTAPDGESRDAFVERAREAARRVEAELGRGGPVLVVSHGGLLNYLLQVLLADEPRDELPFGFEHCAAVVLQRQRVGSGRDYTGLRFGLVDPGTTDC